MTTTEQLIIPAERLRTFDLRRSFQVCLQHNDFETLDTLLASIIKTLTVCEQRLAYQSLLDIATNAQSETYFEIAIDTLISLDESPTRFRQGITSACSIRTISPASIEYALSKAWKPFEVEFTSLVKLYLVHSTSINALLALAKAPQAREFIDHILATLDTSLRSEKLQCDVLNKLSKSLQLIEVFELEMSKLSQLYNDTLIAKLIETNILPDHDSILDYLMHANKPVLSCRI